jgi:hypothetical protein
LTTSFSLLFQQFVCEKNQLWAGKNCHTLKLKKKIKN